METKDIDKSIKERKLHLTKSEKFEHWSDFASVSFLLGTMGFVLINSAIQQEEFSFAAMFVVFVFFLFLRYKLSCTKLNVYKSNLSATEFKTVNRAAAKINNWIVSSSNDFYFSAINDTKGQKEGIKVTAIHRNGKIYLNSMVNPESSAQPFTFGQNRKNKHELIRQYQSILKGNDVYEKAGKELAQKEDFQTNNSLYCLQKWNGCLT